VQVYAVPEPLPRVALFPAGRVTRLSRRQIDANLRDPRHDLRATLMLEEDLDTPAPSPTAAPTTAPDGAIAYRRPTSDEMLLEVTAPADGFLRILEAWDPGWRATVNGREVSPVPADGFYLAVPVSAGANEVRLAFSTPGRNVGLLVSLGGVAGLLLIAFAPPRSVRARPEPDVKTGP
jgi:hypothetical protein